MIIIGITGTLGAGKGTVVHYLEENGFKHFSSRGFIVEELKKRDLPINRTEMAKVANQLRAERGPAYIVEAMYDKAAKQSKATIESIRNPGEVLALRQKKNFYLLSVDADPKLRYERIIKRGSVTDGVSFEKFIGDEEKEMHSDDPHKQNIARCMAMADFKLYNNGTVEQLHNQIEDILKSIKV